MIFKALPLVGSCIHSTHVSYYILYSIHTTLDSPVGFYWRRKTGEPGEKPSKQRREPTTNSSHIWYEVRESNPRHSGDRRTLSLLRHHCFLDYFYCIYLLFLTHTCISTYKRKVTMNEKDDLLAGNILFPSPTWLLMLLLYLRTGINIVVLLWSLISRENT